MKLVNVFPVKVKAVLNVLSIIKYVSNVYKHKALAYILLQWAVNIAYKIVCFVNNVKYVILFLPWSRYNALFVNKNNVNIVAWTMNSVKNALKASTQ